MAKAYNSDECIAIGASAVTNEYKSIQLGTGTNNEEGTFQVFDYPLLDADGYIYPERISGSGGATKSASLYFYKSDYSQYNMDTIISITTDKGYYSDTFNLEDSDISIDIEYSNPIVTVSVVSYSHNYGLKVPIAYDFYDRDSDYFNSDCNYQLLGTIFVNGYQDDMYSDSAQGLSFTVDLSYYNEDDNPDIDIFKIVGYDFCFAAGTLITLSDGTTKAIEDITYEDILKVWNFDDGKDDSAKPIWIMKECNAKEYVLVKLEDGNEIKLVGSDKKYHCMFDVDEQKFNHAVDCIGHNVYTENGITKVVSIEKIVDNVKYYNILTNVHFNIYANHILTSTEINNFYPIKDMKFEKNREVIPYEKFEKYNISLEDYNGYRLGEWNMSLQKIISKYRLRIGAKK